LKRWLQTFNLFIVAFAMGFGQWTFSQEDRKQSDQKLEKKKNTPEEERKKIEHELRQKMRQKIEQDRKELDQLLQGQLFQGMPPEMAEQLEKMLRRFHDPNWHKKFPPFGKDEDDPFNFFFDKMGPDFHQFFDQMRKGVDPFEQGPESGAAVSERWEKLDGEWRLYLNLNVPEGTPIDIKIEKGMVKIEGKLNRQSPPGLSQQEVGSFQKMFSIPEECVASKLKVEPNPARSNQKNPENKEGKGPMQKLLIRFPIKGKGPLKDLEPSDFETDKVPPPNKQVNPLRPGPGDIDL